MKTKFREVSAWVRRTPALLALLAAELLLILSSLWAAVQPPVTGSFTPDQYEIIAEDAEITWDENGRLGVANQATEGQDILQTPFFALKPGHYKFTIDYDCRPTWLESGQRNHSSVRLKAWDNDMAVKEEYAVVSENQHSQTVTLTVLWSAERVRLIFHDEGGYFTVGSVSYTQDMAFAAACVAGWVLLCLALDLALLALLPGSPVCLPAVWRLDILVLAAIVALGCAPLLGEGMLPGGPDIAFHLQRIEGIAAGLRAGQFPVRIYPNAKSGYGYSTSIFYGELLLYFPAVLRLLGVGIQPAYYAYIALVTALTAGLAFLSYYGIFGRHRLALLGSMLHTLAAYRLYSVYQCSFTGAFTAMTFLPPVVYALWRMYTTQPGKRDPRKAVPALILSFTALLQCHMITLELATLCTALVCLVYWRVTFQKQTLLAWIKAVAGVVLLNLWFLVPFATTMATGLYTRVSTSNIQSAGTDLRNLVRADAELNPGPGLLLGALLFVLILLAGPKLDAPLRRLGTWGAAVGFAACLLSTRAMPWNSITGVPLVGRALQVIQFPWRYLTVVVVAFEVASLCAVEALLVLARRRRAEQAALALAAAVVGSTLLYYTELIPDRTRTYWGDTSVLMFTDAHFNLEYMMDFLYVPEPLETSVNDYPVAPADGVEVGEFTRDNGVTTVLCASTRDSDGYVEMPLLYFPGYQVVDGPGSTYITENSMVGVIVPAGYAGTISVAFREPKRWLLADCVSLATAAALLAFALRGRRRRGR